MKKKGKIKILVSMILFSEGKLLKKKNRKNMGKRE